MNESLLYNFHNQKNMRKNKVTKRCCNSMYVTATYKVLFVSKVFFSKQEFVSKIGIPRRWLDHLPMFYQGFPTPWPVKLPNITLLDIDKLFYFILDTLKTTCTVFLCLKIGNLKRRITVKIANIHIDMLEHT